MFLKHYIDQTIDLIDPQLLGDNIKTSRSKQIYLSIYTLDMSFKALLIIHNQESKKLQHKLCSPPNDYKL